MIIFPIFCIQLSSITQSCLTLWDSMKHSTPGLPVHHQLPESTQTHVHWVSDAIHHLILCHPLFLLPSIFPSIRVFSMSQLFTSGGQSIGTSASASVLPVNIQGWFPGEGNGNPLQYSCLEKSHGRRSLVGYSPWGHIESDMTERLHLHFPLELTGLISMLPRGLSRVFSSTPKFKSINSSLFSLLYGPTLKPIEDSYSVKNLWEIWINCLKIDKSSCI